MKLKPYVAALALSAFSAQGFAVQILDDGDDGAGTGLQSQINSITTAPVAGTSSINVNTDQLDDGLDSYWNITASGGSVSTFVVEIAGLANSNTFGIYERGNAGNYVELFSGSDSPAIGSQVTLSFFNDEVRVNSVGTGVFFNSFDFGYYLGSENNPNNAPTFYSDSSLNTNGSDQMVAIQGNNTDTIQIPGYSPGLFTDNEFILAWEDILYENSDKDFNDLVVMVESVIPVPEPGTLALLGLGLAGLGAARRRQKA